MIVFDLECSDAHRFEGWFDSVEAFEEQNAADMVECPYCGDTRIRRVLSPVSVKRSSPGEAQESGGIDYRRLALEVLHHIRENFEDVGSEFAAEALKIHYGVAEKRNIRGSATREEEKTLEEEGVAFVKLPIPVVDDKKKN